MVTLSIRLNRYARGWLLPELVLASFLLVPSVATAQDALADAKSLLDRYCVQCHGPDLAEGDFRVDGLDGSFAERATANAWLEARDRLNLGEMPPDGEPQPASEDVDKLSRWVAEQLRTAERNSLSANGRSLLRRLNRDEYSNTLADLLHLRFPPGESPLDYLPPDGTAEGFDKVSSALLLDPSLMLQYYEVARRIAEEAIVDGPPEFPTRKMTLKYEDLPKSNAIGYMITRRGLNPVPGGLQLIEGDTRSWGMLEYPDQPTNHISPTSGFYRYTLRAGGKRGANGELPRIRVRQDHPDESQQIILETEIDAPWDQPKAYTVELPRDTLGREVHVEILNDNRLYMLHRPQVEFNSRIASEGDESHFAESIRLTGRKVAEGWGGDQSAPDPEKLDLSPFPQVFLDYLEVEGPLYEQWPPRSHTELLFQGELKEGQDPLVYARAIFARFLERAWRRPVQSQELEPILRVVESELSSGGSFHDGLRVGLTAALTSPKFLYLAEPADEKRELKSYELANRLSYFLWNSMPDDELSDLAKSGRLSEPETMSREIQRMIGDPKHQRMLDSFGQQWLRTDSVLAFAPDRAIYRAYDEELGTSAQREPMEFFRYLVEQELSLLNFLDSDFLVINERLAELYDIPGVEGDEFRRVALPADSTRGGLLGMAGVHLAGADGVRTKPVSRAVYVREVLFNNPPDPPPPNAGEIEPNIEGENLTVRQRLIQHQQIESCASCHRSLDPYGLALENFNVIGQWRDVQDGEDSRGGRRPEIDSSGKLPNGTTFANFFEFREALTDQADRFRRGVVEKLWVYALGRPVEPQDNESIERVIQQMEQNDDRWAVVLKAIVECKEFQTK